MIIVHLMGGLGNQMFQYAVGRKLSLHHKTDLLLDCTFLNANTHLHIKREYELNVFKIHARIAKEAELKKFKRLQHNKIIRQIQQHLPGVFSYQLIHEKSHVFDRNILALPDNSWLNGFWQTEKYFSDIEKIIHADFKFKTPPQELNKVLAEKITTCESVSLHIRRGDYAKPENIAYHGTCTPDYYYQAVDILSKKVKIDELFIFSDDPEWAKQNLLFKLPVTYIDHNTGKNSFEDMRLMSLCKHNITANSSFSWWGAWLNSNKNKIVIAPKIWIADPSVDTRDVIPDSWLKL